MSIQDYRNKEIKKIIEQAFAQFNIKDEAEKAEIVSSINAQLDSSKPLSSFSSSKYASSAKYRADVRAALIDIIAHLLHIRDMELSVSQTEAKSRDITLSAKNRLTILENKFHNLTDNIRESFEEGVHSGVHSNTVVRDGKLGVNNAQIPVSLTDLQLEVHPADNKTESIRVETSSNIESLLNSGLASDSLSIKVSVPEEPSIFIAGGFLNGTVVSISFKTETEVIPALLSAKASVPFRIQAAYAGTEEDNYTVNLGRDASLGTYSFVENNENELYKYFKLYLYFPDYSINDKQLEYIFNIHNIKLFKNSENATNAGSFVSNTYTSKSPIIGATLSSKYTGNVNFNIKFEDTSETYPIIPTGLVRKLVVYKEETTTKFEINPFIINPNTLNVKTKSTDITADCEVSEDGFSFTLLNNAANYKGYLYIEYTTNKQVTEGYLSKKPNEAFLSSWSTQLDLHDGIEPYSFKLSKTPLMYAPELDIPGQFSFYKNDSLIEAVNLTDGDNSTTIFEEDLNQFYYKDGYITTNFILTNDQYKVEYQYTCSGVSLELELFNDAKVDDYHIELITLDTFSYEGEAQ